MLIQLPNLTNIYFNQQIKLIKIQNNIANVLKTRIIHFTTNLPKHIINQIRPILPKNLKYLY